jgi:hypothetical protein
MTTFNTVEELMQVLDANPHLLEGLRSWLLTRELLDLPETVARLATRVDQIVEQLTRLTERVGQLIEQQEQTNHRLDQIVDDLGRLKNVGTITATREQAEVIAEFVGLHCQKQLPRNEIIVLSRNQEIPEIRLGDLMSFRRADLIMEATDDDGGLHYIAVEASFTDDERDTRRAVRNAEYLTRFTGRPAQAVIAATRIDHRIQAVLDSDRVVWYQLEDDVSD